MKGPGWPVARPGQVVGLLGGSFDPAHAGHAAITAEAMKRFGLDFAWWIVSPGNPLKADAPAMLDRRIAHARAVARHPRVIVTGIEALIATRYTADTVAALQALYPGVRFVWLMGADNLARFHRWDRWRWIAGAVPLGILARPGERLPALTSPAARLLREDRVPPAALGRAEAPAWAFANIPMRFESSTALRGTGAWKR